MYELKNSLLNFFNKTNKYFTISDLRKEFRIKGEEQTNCLFKALNELEIDGSLFFDESKGYKSFPENLKYGKITICRDGTAFVITNNNKKIYIDTNYINGALNKDIVIVTNIDKTTGRILKVLKRDSGKEVFECIGSGNDVKIVPYSIKHQININITSSIKKKLSDGDLILVSIDTNQKNNVFEAEVVEIIRKDDPDKILKSIAYKHDIEIEFPDLVLKEAELIPTEVTQDDFKNRIDLTNKEIFTIDCDNTKDMDDAVGIEINENGNYVLYINIADVAHYIKEGSKLYEEALKRSTSVYMDNSCIPMLPHTISNGICSLNPNVYRLTRTSEIEITKDGKIVNFKKYDSVIKSRMKMKYSDVNKILEKNIELEEYKPYIKSLKLLDIISQVLEEEKRNRDYIDFAQNEVEIKREDSVINELSLRENGKAQKLIENLMILANQLSAERYCYMPYLYRIHEQPDEDAIKQIINVLNDAGYRINSNNEYITNKAINQVLNEFRENKEFNIISQLILQGMKRARYSNECLGHFALNLYYYSHTTSPIRRCIDLVINTYEKKYDEYEKSNFVPSTHDIEKIEESFKIISEHASQKERKADKAEEEANRIRIAEYAQNFIGETFVGRIYKITNTDVKVIINDTIKGSILHDDIIGDTFKYDCHNYQLKGKHSKKILKIGQELNVTIKYVNPLTGDIKLSTSIDKKVKQKTRH